MRPSVLVSGPAAAALAATLRATERLDVVEASTEAEARAYLSGTAFSRVLDTHPDGRVAALAETLGVPADRAAGDDGPGVWLRRLGVPDAPARRASLGGMDSGAPPDAPAAELRALGEAISELAHRLNNPMAVIQGNAQLALELGRVQGLDAMLTESLADIEAASRELASGFRELAGLRARVDALLAERS